MVVELGMTRGRLVVRIGSKLNLSSLQDSTRVSLACPKERGSPKLSLFFTPRVLWAVGLLSFVTWKQEGLTCPSHADLSNLRTFPLPLHQTRLALDVLASLAAFSSPRRKSHQPQAIPCQLPHLPTKEVWQFFSPITRFLLNANFQKGLSIPPSWILPKNGFCHSFYTRENSG